MEKQRLIENLKAGIEHLVQYNYCKHQSTKKGNSAFVGLIVVIVPVVYLFSAFPYSTIGLLISIGIGLILAKGLSVFEKNSQRDKHVDYVKEMEDAEEQFQHLIGIPIKYFSVRKLENIIESLESGSADTLKEAIGIWERKEANDEQNRLAKEQIYATNEAADAAIDTARATKKVAKEAGNIRNDNYRF